MRSRIRRRARALREPFGKAGLLVAIVALVFAMTGGAFAAKYVITSTKQIKPKVLKQLKGKTGPAGPQGPAGTNGTNGTNGKDGAQGSEGKQGPKGDTGEKGEKGDPGDPWTAGGTLPAGATETGVWVADVPSSMFANSSVSFTIPLAAELGAGNAIAFDFAGAPEKENCEDPGHPGPASVSNPEADPGYLCVYVGQGADLVEIYKPISGSVNGASVSGARLLIVSLSAPNTAAGSWAVTG